MKLLSTLPLQPKPHLWLHPLLNRADFSTHGCNPISSQPFQNPSAPGCLWTDFSHFLTTTFSLSDIISLSYTIWSSLVAQTRSLPARQESWIWALDQEAFLEKRIPTHSSILAWESHGQRSLAGYSPRDHKESDTTQGLTLSLSL